MNRLNLLWITNVPSPYRVDFFNELGKLCNLTVIFERKTSAERDESWEKFTINNFQAVFLDGIKIGVDSSFSLKIIRQIKKINYDKIIISSYSSPTEMIAATYLIIKNKKFIIETDGGFHKNGKSLKEKIKKFIISHADKCFSTSKESDNYYMYYGAKKENIIRYPFTSLYKSDILKKVPTQDEKNKLKKIYNIKEEKIILSVGQFIYRKGFDILLKAMNDVNDINVGVYIIGGNITDEYKKIIQKYNLKNIHFIKFLDKSNVFNYYKLSDLFVLPTREDIWGLVINEAMANGCPIITTDKCIAGTELIEDEENGYIIKSEDVNQLVSKINSILHDENLRIQMCENNLKKISQYTFENMAKVHIGRL